MSTPLHLDRDTLQRLGTYLLAAGGMGLAAGEAGAVEVDIGLDQTITADGGTTSESIDVDDNGVDDFQISVTDPGQIIISGLVVGNEVNVFYRDTCDQSNNYAGNIAAGTTIDDALNYANAIANSSSTAWHGWVVIWDPDKVATCNNFVTGEWGTLALRFMRDGQQHYAYLNIRRRAGSNILDILGGGYESNVGGSIQAQDFARGGSAQAIPVGGAVPITLALLAAGAAALRRRKSADH